MKTRSGTRAGNLAGLFLLAAVLLMTVAQAAQAAVVAGGGGGTGEATVKPSVVGLSHLSTPSSGSLGRLNGILQRDNTAAPSPPPSVSSATTVWIAVAALAGGLLIVLWAFVRGRVRRRDVTFDCEASFLGC